MIANIYLRLTISIWLLVALSVLTLSFPVVQWSYQNHTRYKELERDELGMNQVIVVRKAGNLALDLIKRFEVGPDGKSFATVPYVCPAGYWTIGWGHEILPGEKFVTPIDESLAYDLLMQDIKVAERSVCRLINAPLQDWQYDALVSWTFNLGGGRLQASTLRAVINRGEHQEAPAQIMRWVYGGKPPRKLRGLIIRRNAEATLYKEG